MKILFFYPPDDGNSLFKNNNSFLFAPPLGILYLSKILEDQGHTVKVIDLRSENIRKKHLKFHVLTSDIIGISIPSFSINNSIELCSMIREIDANIPIIVGGPHCSLYPKELLQKIDADICVIGEGEKPIKKIVESIEKKVRPDLPGIYYKISADEISGKRGFNLVEDLDTLPYPARHLVKKYDYGYLFGYKFFKGKCTAIITSRGCPYKCRFCSRNIPGMKNYRTRSAKDVFEELCEIYNKGYKSVIIVDDNFLANKKRSNKILNLLIKEKMSLDIFVQGARVDSANKEIYQKMKNAGVKAIAFGIESGSQSILNFYNKHTTLNQINYAVNLSKQSGFFTIGNFIMGAPVENEQNIVQTINFARSLPLDFALFSILEYTAGSQLWSEAVSEGKIDKEEYRVISDSFRGLGNFSLKELEKWQKKAYIRFYLNHNYLKNQLQSMLKKRDFSIIKGGFKLFLKLN